MSTLGVVLLDTNFPRPPGDIGHPGTFRCPVIQRRVPGATVERIVTGDGEDLTPIGSIVEAVQSLAADGASMITTSCGFLIRHQKALTRACPVPVLTSSLMQIPLVQATLPPERQVGVITIDATRLGTADLEAAGARASVPVIGVETGQELWPVIMGDRDRLDLDRAEADVVDAAQRLSAAVPGLGAIVLECTNMPPYAQAVRRALGLPVFDITTMVDWFSAAATSSSPSRNPQQRQSGSRRRGGRGMAGAASR